MRILHCKETMRMIYNTTYGMRREEIVVTDDRCRNNDHEGWPVRPPRLDSFTSLAHQHRYAV